MAKDIKQTSAEQWKRRQSIAQHNQERMFDKFSYWYSLMYAHVNSSQYALWRSKVFIPVIPSKAWSMIARLTQLDPGFETGLYGEFLNDPEAAAMADKMQWKLEHDWSNPDFDEPMRDKLYSPLVDAAVTGTGFAMVPWTTHQQTRFEHEKDELTGGLDFTTDVKVTKSTGYNDLIPLDVMSCFISPGAKSVQTAAWFIVEDFVTYDQLKAENEASGIERYKNLDKVKELKATSDANAVYKKSRERLTQEQDPISADSTVKQFRRYQCFEKDSNMIYTFAAGQSASGNSDEWIELDKKKNPYWHGKFPIVAFHVKKRPHSIWGQGVFEDTERLQSAVNDLMNHYFDSANLSLDGMIMKPEGEDYIYTVEPGGEFLYKDKEPTQFKFPEPNPNQFNTLMNFLESTIEDATISRYSQGTPNSQQDKTNGTAAGIMALQNAAGDKIGFMKQNYSTSLREIGLMWLCNNQQFMSEPQTLQGTNDKGMPAAVEIKPEDLQAPMTLRINDASMEPESKQQQLQNFQNYLASMMQLKDQSLQQAASTKWATKPLYLDFTQLAQNLSQKYGQSNIDKIMLEGDEVEQLMQNSQAPFISPKETMKLDLNELYGSEAASLLTRNGIQPDPKRQAQVPVDTQGNPINPIDRAAFAAAGLPVYGRDSMPIAGPGVMPPEQPGQPGLDGNAVQAPQGTMPAMSGITPPQ